MSKSPWHAICIGQIQAHTESLADHIAAMEAREGRLRRALATCREWFKQNHIPPTEAPPPETFDALDDD